MKTQSCDPSELSKWIGCQKLELDTPCLGLIAGNVVKFDIDKNYLRTDPLVELQIIRELLDLQLITQEQAMEMTDLTPNGSQGMQ